MRSVSICACLLAISMTSMVTAEKAEAQPFMPPALSVPDLVVQEEYSRRIADILLTWQMAQQFQLMGFFEMQSAEKLKKEEGISLLEVDSFKTTDLEEEEEAPQTAKDLQDQASFAKMSALKFMHLQVVYASGDIEKAYWTNRMLSLALPPQLLLYKLYKQYINTVALSLAIQVHDAFTFESHIDNFNDNVGDFAGQSSAVTELVAEQQLYSKWSMLTFLRLQLLYLSMYDQQVTQALVSGAVQGDQQQQQSFVELDATAEPNKNSFMPGGDVMTQYAQLSYFKLLLKFYTIFSEMQLTQTGAMAATMKLQAVALLNDANSNNDDKASNIIKQSDTLYDQVLPFQYIHWSQLVQGKVFIDSYLLAIDMQLPGMAPLRQMQREGNAIEDLVFAQTAEPKLTAPQTSN